MRAFVCVCVYRMLIAFNRSVGNEPSEGVGDDRFQSTASVRAMAASGSLQTESRPNDGGSEETLHLAAPQRQGQTCHPCRCSQLEVVCLCLMFTRSAALQRLL